MKIFDRVKNILVAPKTEWPLIEAENTPHVKVLTGYVLLLALIPAVATFIGYGLIGQSFLGVRIASIGLGLRHAVIQYITMVGGVYITALVINIFAKTFDAKPDFNRAFSLVAYAFTPMFVAGILSILPVLRWFTWIGGLYSLYLLYLGIQPMMKVPNEKKTAYFVVSLIVMLVAVGVLTAILTSILVGAAALGAAALVY
jgi:hypothetical protein